METNRASLALPNVPLHLIQRGHNRQDSFFADADYQFCLDWLAEHAGKTGGRIHAYVLMTNHVHLLVSAARPEAPGAGCRLHWRAASRWHKAVDSLADVF